MKAYTAIFSNAIVETGGFPGLGEERHGDRLTEIIELEAGCTDGGEDGGVVDGVGRDGEGTGTEQEVGVGCCSIWLMFSVDRWGCWKMI